MDATTILDRLGSLGISVEAADDRLRLEPGSRVPPDLIEELRQHKQEIILKLKGFHFKYTDAQASQQELEEISARVLIDGYVLLWSPVLCDLVAFYRDEEARRKIPPGFVPYSVMELGQLFGDKHVPEASLKVIHEAKKQGDILYHRGSCSAARRVGGLG